MSMTKNEEKTTKTLLEAAKNNNVKPFLSALNSHWNIDLSYDWEGVRRTPLMVACMYSSINVIELLLDTNKVFVDFRSSDGKTSLEFARESNIPDHLITRMLLAGRHWIIYNFKIIACPYRSCLENRSSCPYVHKNDAARRDPASVHYSPTLCKNFTKGYCREASNCRLAHGRTEINYHPNVFRTQRCFHGERCNRIDTCPHAHYGEEKLPRYRPAAVLAKPPQTQQSSWLPIRSTEPQDNTAVPPQEETQLQDNESVPMQQPQPLDNAAVPPLQEAQLQDIDAVPTVQQSQPLENAAVHAGVSAQQLQSQENVAVPIQQPQLLENAAVHAAVSAQQLQSQENVAVPIQQPLGQESVEIPIQQPLPEIAPVALPSFSPDDLETVLQHWESCHQELYEECWQSVDRHYRHP